MKKLRILLADDHPLLRDGTRGLLERELGCEICAEAGNGTEAIEQAALHHPDVVVLDYHMPGDDALSVVQQIKRHTPEAELVIYTAGVTDEIIDRLFVAGIKSFVPKTEGPEFLVEAVQAAGEHRMFVTPTVGAILMRMATGTPSRPLLTERENEVVRLIAAGIPNRQIALKLRISERTAETHRAAILRKLGASSTADVVRYAIRHGMIEA